MNRFFSRRALLAVAAALVWGVAGMSHAAEEAADAFIKRVSTDILDAIKADKSIKNGEVNKIVALVDQRVMPHVDFLRMTASAIGPAWRQATPEQQKRLQEEFKILLIRTYSGAVSQVSDQKISIKPLRAAADDKEVLVRSEVLRKGDPIQLDYRVEKTAEGAWKVYNMNVMGVWLVENYKTQFSQEINAKGIDGLIASLTERNKSNARSTP